jgi:Protein of unknown function (DUF4232)
MTKLSRRAVAAAVAAVALGAGTATWGAAAASAAPAPAPVPVCTASQLNVWVSPDSANGTAGTTYYNLDITNVSGRPCQLRGWPAVVATNSRGRQFGAPARAVGHGPVAAVTIFPDATAHANLGYVDAALSRSCRPATAAALSVGLPGVRGARHAFFPLQICTRRGGNLTIGNIQPGA